MRRSGWRPRRRSWSGRSFQYDAAISGAHLRGASSLDANSQVSERVRPMHDADDEIGPPVPLPPGKGWRAVTASFSNFVVAYHPVRSCGDRGRAPCGASRSRRRLPHGPLRMRVSRPRRFRPIGIRPLRMRLRQRVTGSVWSALREQLQIRIVRSWPSLIASVFNCAARGAKQASSGSPTDAGCDSLDREER